MCMCGEFLWKLENNQLSDYLFSCQMEIVINFSRICTQSLVPKVRFCRSEFGLSGLKMTDFGCNGQNLILVLVNFRRFFLKF